MICEYCRLSRSASAQAKAAYFVTVKEGDRDVMRARVCVAHRRQLLNKLAPEPAKPWSHNPGSMTGEFINPADKNYRVVVEEYSDPKDGEEGAV